MNNLIFVLEKKKIFNFCILNTKIKYNKLLLKIYLMGLFGILNIKINIKKQLSIIYLKQKLLYF